MRITVCLSLLLSLLCVPAVNAAELPIKATAAALIQQHGQDQADRIRAGVERVARRWTESDGTGEQFARFCEDFYVADPTERKRLLARLETVLTATHGHLYEISRTAGQWTEFAGDQLPRVDELLATFDPAPDLAQQLYTQRIAFLLLLNFETPTLDTMQREGRGWSVDEWVAARLTRGLPPRIPADVQTAVRRTHIAAKNWIYSLHPKVGSLVDAAKTPKQCCERLVEEANERGGSDNITVVVVFVGPDD